MKKLSLFVLALLVGFLLPTVVQASGCATYSYNRTVYRPSYQQSYYQPSYDYTPTYERAIYQPFYFLHGYAIQTPAQAYIQLPGYAVGAAPVIQAPQAAIAPAPAPAAPAPQPQAQPRAEPVPTPTPSPKTDSGPTNADVIAAIRQLDANTQSINNDLQEIKKRVKRLEGTMPPVEKEKE